MTKIKIGIDAGTNTGIAVWNTQMKKYIHIVKTDFWGAIIIINKYVQAYDNSVEVVIEYVSGNKPVFGVDKIYHATTGNLYSKLGAVSRKAQNVGMVKKETDLLVRYCEGHKILVKKIVPGKYSATKLKNEVFLKLINCKVNNALVKRVRYSEHERDACMLVIN